MGDDANRASGGKGDGERTDGLEAGDGPPRRRVLRLASGAGAALAGVGTAGLNGVVGATTPADSAPPAPADLAVTGTSETTISLEWSVPDATAVDHFTTFVDGNGYPLVENDRPTERLPGGARPRRDPRDRRRVGRARGRLVRPGDDHCDHGLVRRRRPRGHRLRRRPLEGDGGRPGPRRGRFVRGRRRAEGRDHRPAFEPRALYVLPPRRRSRTGGSRRSTGSGRGTWTATGGTWT